MAIKPILFNMKMVRAILDGRKSCTRRINKDANDYVVPDMDFYDSDKRTYAVHNYADKEHKIKLSTVERTCPICPGDILYVRGTWCMYGKIDDFGHIIEGTDKYYYLADGANPTPYNCFLVHRNGHDEYKDTPVWHPSIHMPKESARIWLKVTDVRVERLQDITPEQIAREGIGVEHPYLNDNEKRYVFSNLWDSTIKKSDLDRYGWDTNPYVWVISFERCEKPEDA